MLRTLTAAALVATTLAGAASAATSANQAIASDVLKYAPNADVSSLTPAEVTQIRTILLTVDNESEKQGKIRLITN
ncbi:hypothetical protein [Tropicibacter naphthalenivorans]|uniref:Uncharacterized protein n=1 Tax=Tropicibacter naphthalenivorans TaxID=441103 RepID=A0A0P1GX31_9RHOB|nr:hypothetical protein [Tropicibacter naphthalenivorans]CUH78935.1 hypothetical protein TRN7648_02245 [Tropicibacter naphthalenivorans]SMD10459.1 hypothetical protein SAMN04488093_12220 [Tropicibacter naphthalenivorans]